MVNRVRGEVPLRLAGRDCRLCLTLGALAEIESGLGVDSLLEADARLARPRMADLIVILGALLRGGGHDISDAELAAMAVNVPQAARAIERAFAAATRDLGEAADLGEAVTPSEAP